MIVLDTMPRIKLFGAGLQLHTAAKVEDITIYTPNRNLWNKLSRWFSSSYIKTNKNVFNLKPSSRKDETATSPY